MLAGFKSNQVRNRMKIRAWNLPFNPENSGNEPKKQSSKIPILPNKRFKFLIINLFNQSLHNLGLNLKTELQNFYQKY